MTGSGATDRTTWNGSLYDENTPGDGLALIKWVNDLGGQARFDATCPQCDAVGQVESEACGTCSECVDPEGHHCIATSWTDCVACSGTGYASDPRIFITGPNGDLIMRPGDTIEATDEWFEVGDVTWGRLRLFRMGPGRRARDAMSDVQGQAVASVVPDDVLRDLGDARRKKRAREDDGRCSCGHFRAMCQPMGRPCFNDGIPS